MVCGAVSLALGALAYALFPSFHGAIIAVVFEGIGFSMIVGASEALIHDTLVQQGKVQDYVKTLGRAQSFGLVGNVVLITLVPLTYPLNHHLPFLIGALMSSVLVVLMASLTEPTVHESTPVDRLNMFRAVRLFINRYTILFFVAVGLLASSFDSYASFGPLILVDLGFRPQLQGLIYAAASIVGAINGRILHLFKRFSLSQYTMVDLAVGSLSVLAIGLTHNLVVTIAAIVLNMGFWRVRNIVYQDHLLGRFRDQAYKATLVSTMGFFAEIHIWMPIVFALIINKTGFYTGFATIGVLMIVVLTPLILLGVYLLDHQKPGLLPGKLPRLFTRPPK